MLRSVRSRWAASRGEPLTAVATGHPLPSGVLSGMSPLFVCFRGPSEGSRSGGTGPVSCGGVNARYFAPNGSGSTGSRPASRSRQFFAGFLGHPSTKVRWRTRHDPGSALCCTWYTWAEQKVFACAPRVATVR